MADTAGNHPGIRPVRPRPLRTGQTSLGNCQPIISPSKTTVCCDRGRDSSGAIHPTAQKPATGSPIVPHTTIVSRSFSPGRTHRWFQNHVWPHATSLFFIIGRLSFYHVGGEKGGTAGAPSVLIAYGKLADQRLRENKIIAGQYLQNLPNNIFLGSA